MTIEEKLCKIEKALCSDRAIIFDSIEKFPKKGNVKNLYFDKSQKTIYYWDGDSYEIFIEDKDVFELYIEDSNSINLSGQGTLASPLKADLILSPDANNIAEVRSNGLYVSETVVEETIPTLQEVVDEGNSTTTPIIFNSPVTKLGTLISDNFPSLNATNWTDFSSGLSYGVNGVSFTTGSSSYTNYLRLNKYFPYEKLDIVFEVTPTDVSAGSGVGIGMTQEVSLYAGFLYWRFDFANKRVAYGSTTSTTSGFTNSLTGAILNNRCRVTIKRFIERTVVILENTVTGEKAFGNFLIKGWGSQGRFTLAFLGGSGTVHNFNITSSVQDFNYTKGVLFIGDSFTVGGGATVYGSTRFSDVAMFGSREDYEVVGVNSVKSAELVPYLLEVLPEIRPKYVVISVGVNDSNQGVSTGSFNTNLSTLVTNTSLAGSIPLVMEVFPQVNSNVTPYNTEVTNVCTAYSVTKISVFNALKDSGTSINNLYNADGVHVNDLGNEVIASAIQLSHNGLYQSLIEKLTNQEILLELNNLPVGEDTDDMLTISQDNIVKRVKSQVDRRRILLNGGNASNGTTVLMGSLDAQTVNIITNKINRLLVDSGGLTVYAYANGTTTTSSGSTTTGYTSGQGGGQYINFVKTGGAFSGTVMYHLFARELFALQTFNASSVQHWPIITRQAEGNVVIASFIGLGDPTQVAGNGSVTNAGIKPERYRLYTMVAKNNQPNIHAFAAECQGGDGEGVNAFFIRNTGNVLVGSETDLPLARFKVDAVSFNTVKGSMPFPRMTQAQRTAMGLDASYAGLHVYQTDGTEGVYVYKSTGWQFAY